MPWDLNKRLIWNHHCAQVNSTFVFMKYCCRKTKCVHAGREKEVGGGWVSGCAQLLSTYVSPDLSHTCCKPRLSGEGERGSAALAGCAVTGRAVAEASGRAAACSSSSFSFFLTWSLHLSSLLLSCPLREGAFLPSFWSDGIINTRSVGGELLRFLQEPFSSVGDYLSLVEMNGEERSAAGGFLQVWRGEFDFLSGL